MQSQPGIVLAIAILVGCSPQNKSKKQPKDAALDSACIARYTFAKGIKDAQTALGQGEYRLLTVSSYGEQIVIEIPGIGGKFDVGAEDRPSIFRAIGPMEFLAEETDEERHCNEARKNYAAGYNEQTAFKEPTRVIKDLIDSHACHIRSMDINYIVGSRAVKPDLAYKPIC